MTLSSFTDMSETHEEANIQHEMHQAEMTMPPSSFLHAASAKAQQANASFLNDLSVLRMLLIEEDPGHFPHNDTGSLVNPKLAFSLVMDAARAVVASSNLICRGCHRSSDVVSKNDVGKGFDDTNQATEGPGGCRCCKVALLIPGETKKSRKRRKKSNNHESSVSRVVGTPGKMQFPINCKPENNSSLATSLLFTSTYNGDSTEWDEKILNQIHIKYVNAPADLIRYLAYAPSLPAHLQPLEGIFVIGLGDLMSRENQTSGIMEMTHALSILSDTGKELEVNRRNILKAGGAGRESITLIATLCPHTYQSLPKRMMVHFYQWIDYIAVITSLKSPGLTASHVDQNDSSIWELAVTTSNQFDTSMDKQAKSTSTSSFRITHPVNNHHESIQEIVWNV
ncbi:hypothetical protein ACHAW6_011393 [Cyclotella cf. meneghiniana]